MTPEACRKKSALPVRIDSSGKRLIGTTADEPKENKVAESNGNSRIDRIEKDLEKLVGIVGSQANQIGILLEHGQRTNEFLQRTAEAQLRLAEAQNKLAEAQNKLEAAQLETAEKLDALIRIADEWIRNRPAS